MTSVNTHLLSMLIIALLKRGALSHDDLRQAAAAGNSAGRILGDPAQILAAQTLDRMIDEFIAGSGQNE